MTIVPEDCSCQTRLLSLLSFSTQKHVHGISCYSFTFLSRTVILNPPTMLCWDCRVPFFRQPVSNQLLLGSLSNNVFEGRTSTGSGLFSFFDGGFAQIFSQIASITVKKLRNTNFLSSRHVKRENTSLPVDVRRSKTSLLKLPIITLHIKIEFRLNFFNLG